MAYPMPFKMLTLAAYIRADKLTVIRVMLLFEPHAHRVCVWRNPNLAVPWRFDKPRRTVALQGRGLPNSHLDPGKSLYMLWAMPLCNHVQITDMEALSLDTCFFSLAVMRVVPPLQCTLSLLNVAPLRVWFGISHLWYVAESHVFVQHMWGSALACACTEHTRIRTVLSSVFKLGLSCVISKCLTICGRFLHPPRDLDSMAAANSQPTVFAQEHSLKSVMASVYT